MREQQTRRDRQKQRKRERDELDYFRRWPRYRGAAAAATDGCGYMIRSIALGGEDGMEEKVLFRSVKLWKSEKIDRAMEEERKEVELSRVRGGASDVYLPLPTDILTTCSYLTFPVPPTQTPSLHSHK